MTLVWMSVPIAGQVCPIISCDRMKV